MRVQPRLAAQAFAPPRRVAAVRLNPVVALLICVGALTFQTFLRSLTPLASSLDLPLVAVAYLALMRRSPLIGMAIGMLTGLAQDGLTHGPLGLYGMVNTIIGYAAGSVGHYIEVQYPGARSVLTALFFALHQGLLWALEGALLGGARTPDPALTLMFAAVHAGLALIFYSAFDGLVKRS